MKMTYLTGVLALFLAVGCTTSEFGPKDIPKSKWSQKGVFKGKPFEFVIIFREDYNFEGIMNGKAFISGGNYELSGDTVYFRDPLCNMNNRGSYTMSFKADSLTFHLVADTCSARRRGTDNETFIRIK